MQDVNHMKLTDRHENSISKMGLRNLKAFEV